MTGGTDIRSRGIIVVIVGLAAVAALAGCTPASPAPTTSATTRVASPTATASATPSAAVPVLAPTLSAERNQPYFDLVNNKVIAANAGAGGRDFIDALVAAGFDKAAMQVTPDRTAVNLAADSVQFSVLFNEKCLVGQYGPASGGYHSVVVSPTAQGACLVGSTRPIDW